MSRQLTVGRLLTVAAHTVPKQKAACCEDQVLTYETLNQRALHLAGWLQGQGISHDDKVAFLMKNSLEYYEIFFGVALSGGVGVPLNFRLSPNEIVYNVTNSDSQILVIDEEFVDMVASIRHQLPLVREIVVITDKEISAGWKYSAIFETPFAYKEVFINDNDDCMIMYTSGTTGRPKGAILSHKNLVANTQNITSVSTLTGESRQIIVAPLFHIAAIGTSLGSFLVKGTVFVQRQFDPVTILETMQKEKITQIFLVPAMWRAILSVPNIGSYDLSSMESCALGADKAPASLKEAILKTFTNAKLAESFGQTEMSPVTTHLKGDDAIRKSSSVGKPIMNVEVRIVDEQMNDVPIGEVGEIVYRGPTMMKGYYKLPEATEEAFRGGWFHSGDLVMMDDEGFVYVMDRKKDMIISGGENIYPAEIEAVLSGHEGIMEVAVVGVPDEKWGESVKAYVVLKPSYTLTDQDVIKYCREHLASYKRPKIVEFIDILPRNASGKILKHTLRETIQK